MWPHIFSVEHLFTRVDSKCDGSRNCYCIQATVCDTRLFGVTITWTLILCKFDSVDGLMSCAIICSVSIDKVVYAES